MMYTCNRLVQVYIIFLKIAIHKSNAYMEKSTVMEHQSYYAELGGKDCNRVVSDRMLAVNCTGACVLDYRFMTDNPHGREDYYLQYIIGGELIAQLNGQKCTMRAGDAIIYMPHTHYHYEIPESVRYYWVHFSGAKAASLIDECGFANACIYQIGLHERLTSCFERLFTDFIVRDRYFELSQAEIVLKLLLDIARLKSDRGQEAESDARIDRVIAKIHRSFDQPLSVSELAAGEFLSEGRLRTLFRQRCGMSPQQYLTALRISTAKQLLEHPDITIAEVARSVGISDPLYFSRVFRAHTGVSPSEYRRM